MLKPAPFSFLLALILFACSFAQPFNTKEYNFAISGFKGDTLRYTGSFAAGDNEGLKVIIRSPVEDSAKFIVGYLRGYQMDVSTTAWTQWDYPWCVLDTFDASTAANFKSIDSMISNSGNDSDVVAALDSTTLVGYTTMTLEIGHKVFRSDYGRIVFKGLSGNRVAPYQLLITVKQPRYSRVDIGSRKQPD